ncbi:MAG: glycosyltransferase family 4 protein [Deltaproteobacteria bacterium]|nr:glycosyltransferase family 4 protein [Deltaproteobacteria bacterium]
MEGNVTHHDLEINYDTYPSGNSIKKILPALKKRSLHFKRLKKLIFELQPDIITSFGGAEAVFLKLISEKTKLVFESHFHRYYKIQATQNIDSIVRVRYFFEKFFEETYLRKFDKVVLLTKKDQKNYPDLTNTIVIPNSLHKIPAISSMLTNKKVLAIGRLNHQKGFDYLIQAWSIVIKSAPDWKLVIVGSGEDKLLLQNMIRNLRLEDSITIKPPTDKIENEYLESSIFVLSSRYEGFGLVLIEAMSYGVPCVSFDCPCGPDEIIQDKIDGLLVPVENLTKLADELILLMNNRDLLIKMGKKAKENVTRFKDDIILEKWISLYNSIIGNS